MSRNFGPERLLPPDSPPAAALDNPPDNDKNPPDNDKNPPDNDKNPPARSDHIPTLPTTSPAPAPSGLREREDTTFGPSSSRSPAATSSPAPRRSPARQRRSRGTHELDAHSGLKDLADLISRQQIGREFGLNLRSKIQHLHAEQRRTHDEHFDTRKANEEVKAFEASLRAQAKSLCGVRG